MVRTFKFWKAPLDSHAPETLGDIARERGEFVYTIDDEDDIDGTLDVIFEDLTGIGEIAGWDIGNREDTQYVAVSMDDDICIYFPALAIEHGSRMEYMG